ncbi:MAG: hypothetical protein HC828_08410, partial [Blastochloris sp.]|nr:hypothetical protein [Blastochloris sp.]
MFRLVVRMLWIILLFITPLLLAGCDLPIGNAITPEEEAINVLAGRGSAQVRQHYQVIGTRNWDSGKVVLLTGPGEQANTQGLGFVFVQQRAIGWRGGMSGYGSVMAPNPGDLIVYGEFTELPSVPSSIVYGRVVAPGVTGVESQFANGLTLRDPASDQAFALFTDTSLKACTLRAAIRKLLDNSKAHRTSSNVCAVAICDGRSRRER